MIVLGALGLVGAFLAPGCSDQGEGERCDTGNNDSDCQPGLVCISPPNPTPGLSPDVTGNFRCCPPDLRNATTPQCTAGTSSNDSGPPPDSGNDASNDATAADTGTDAPIDAPATDSGNGDGATDSGK